MILVCMGTRPEQLKLAPVVKLAQSRGLPIHVHCTNQSPDLLDPEVLSWDSDWEGWPAKVALVVVQGDTRTAFDSALCAYVRGIPVFHLEAGVRTYDLTAPWPEEGYRQMISRIARYHACSTMGNLNQLRSERTGHDRSHPSTLRVTGSPIVESVWGRADPRDGSLEYPEVVITLHRRENRGHFADILSGVWAAINLKHSYGWYSHPNGWAVQENPTGMVPSAPLNAREFASIVAGAKVVVTDSGGVQEECNALGVPCVVARNTTDRPESVGKGGAILAGVTAAGVSQAIHHALQMDRTTIDRTIFGDGTASQQIVDWWEEIIR